MSGARHTPGPWSYETRGDGYHVKGAISGHTVRVATVHGMQSHDAKLVATAPDLLEAARAAEAYISGARAELAIDRREALDSVLPALRAAIAKAEGRS